MTLGMEVGLGRSDIVLDGDPAPPKKGGTTALSLLAYVNCGQKKTKKRTQPPIFDPCAL